MTAKGWSCDRPFRSLALQLVAAIALICRRLHFHTSDLTPPNLPPMNYSRAVGLGSTLRRTVFSTRLSMILLPPSSSNSLSTLNLQPSYQAPTLLFCVPPFSDGSINVSGRLLTPVYLTLLYSSVQTQSLKPDEATVILNTQRLKRPTSPHFTIYQPQLTWVASIANRITGAGLSVRASAIHSYRDLMLNLCNIQSSMASP
jgi:hypothetical protein